MTHNTILKSIISSTYTPTYIFLFIDIHDIMPHLTPLQEG